MEPKQITTSVYTFSDLIGSGALYVDKTAYLYKLVQMPKGCIFCARPPRFGKSLTVSTLEAIFQGRRELFAGLQIDRMRYDWPVHPVVHLDFSQTDSGSLQSLEDSLIEILNRIADAYQVTTRGNTPALRFRSLIEALYLSSNKTGVVVLIDEYDKPISDNLDNPELHQIRKMMDNFFQIIKGCEPFERFVFITGVTRFAKVSVFGKLNNLTDISMNADYACMMGYTQEELESNFSTYLDDAISQSISNGDGDKIQRKDLLAEMAFWYDGYLFHPNAQRVYNPVSIGLFFFNNAEFRNYWFETGTPTLLVRLVALNQLTISDVADAKMFDSSLDSFDIGEMADHAISKQRLLQLLFQTGYLTIDRQIPDMPDVTYALRYPNQEVELSFERNIVDAYVNKGDDWVLNCTSELIKELRRLRTLARRSRARRPCPRRVTPPRTARSP